MRDEYKIAIIGIFAIVAIEAMALFNGIDGLALGAATTGIGAILGYVFKNFKVSYVGPKGDKGATGKTGATGKAARRVAK